MGKIFKKSLMGFNQGQVIAYIDAMLERQKAQLNGEKDKYTQLNIELEALQQEHIEQNEQLAAQLIELEALKAEQQNLLTVKSENQSLIGEIGDIKAKTDAQAVENDKLAADLTQIQGKLQGQITQSSQLFEQLKTAQQTIREISPLRSECEQLRQHIAQLERRNARPSVVAKISERAEQSEILRKTDELWDSLKGKIDDLSQEFSQLAQAVHDTEDKKINKVYSIKDILERVKRIGDKI